MAFSREDVGFWLAIQSGDWAQIPQSNIDGIVKQEHMLFNKVPWRAPVKIRLQCGLERIFTTVFGALEFLENEWLLRQETNEQSTNAVAH